MKQALALILISSTLAGACASPSAGKAVSQTRAGLADAALSPLEDLNLRQEEIPNVLEDIKNPYEVSSDISCEDMEVQVAALNRVLPPDWDAAPKGEESSLTDKAADTASDSLLDAVADEARGLIPYRGWVRRLSGAISYDKKLKAAYEKGAHRRTYLKALGSMKGCADIARPALQPETEETPAIQYRRDAPAERVAAPLSTASARQAQDRSGELPASPPAHGPLRLTPGPSQDSEDDTVVDEEALPEVGKPPVRREAPTWYQPTGR